MASSVFVPLTVRGFPGTPFLTVTTTPSPVAVDAPTASQTVAVGQEMAVSTSTPETGRGADTAPIDTPAGEEDGPPPPQAASIAPSPTTSPAMAIRTRALSGPTRVDAGRPEPAGRRNVSKPRFTGSTNLGQMP